MNCIGTYDGTIFYNPANKFCIVSVKTADQSVPAEARSNRRYKDHLIRFTAVGYEIPRTDAVELELDGEWTKGKYGVQLQVEQWREIVPRTKNGVEGYLASGLIKGIGPKTAADIVERFGVDTLDILEHQPERLLEIRGITESKLEDIKASYAENRMLQGIMTLLAPFKITPKTALKIYQYFGPTSVEILEKSPFELCQISGFGFRRVDAIVQKSGGNLHDSMRIKGAVFCALDEGKSKRGHLYISSEELEKSALKLLNEKIPVPELRLHQQEVRDMMQEMILNGAIVSVKDNIYLPRVFAQEDETARRIAQRLVTQMPVEHIAPVLEQVKVEMGLRLSAQQEAAVYAAFRHGLSVITGSPGTGKTTVLRTILEVYRRLHPDGKIALMAPTGRASRRMSESTGFEDARTLHSGLGLTSEEDEGSRNRKSEPLSADLIIVDEFSMVDMWLAEKFFERMKINARIVLVGDPDQLPSVGAGNVFREIIETKIVPVTVLDQIFRQSKDSLIAYNAKFINEGNTKLFYGPDFVFVSGDSQEDTAEKIMAMAQRLHIDTSDEIIYRVRKLRQRHDELVIQCEAGSLELQAEKMAEKYPNVDGICRELQKKYTYAEEEYMVVAPENIFAIIKEGRMLHHCVGNDGSGERYYERMERRESFILFLRRTDEPEDPYYTLEIEPDGTVRQKRTLFDRQHEDIEQATDFLRRWQKVIAERLTGRDLKLAAESRILREKEFIQLKKDRVIIHTGHLAGRLLADVLMADLMENTDSIQSPALAAAA